MGGSARRPACSWRDLTPTRRARGGSNSRWSMKREGTAMYLAIEIGGTKLQLCVGPATAGPLAVLERLAVDPDRGAEGIREQIARVAPPLIARHAVVRVRRGIWRAGGCGRGTDDPEFPDRRMGRLPFGDWCQNVFDVPVVIENDSNLAGLGEARFGAGRRARIVFYSNVGSGIGGALVIDGSLYPGGTGTAVAEIGHAASWSAGGRRGRHGRVDCQRLGHRGRRRAQTARMSMRRVETATPFNCWPCLATRRSAGKRSWTRPLTGTRWRWRLSAPQSACTARRWHKPSR